MDDRLRCPTCGAEQEPSDVCRRCKCDLALLRAAWSAAAASRRKCMAALKAGDPEAAVRQARRLYAMKADAEAAKLLAVCQLLAGDEAAAWSSARRAARHPS